MIERIIGIKVKGKCFAQDTSFEFFRRGDVLTRLALVYGKNGSGKSAVAEGFRQLSKGRAADSQIASSLLHKNGTVPIVPPCDFISVFDEKYIDKNIRVQGDGLGSIVLIGAQVDLQKQIEATETEITRLTQCLDEQKKLCMKYADATDTSSPANYLEKIYTRLRGDWAETDKLLKGNTVNSAVRESVALEICTLPDSTKTISQLRSELAEKKSLYDKLKSYTTGFPNAVKCVTYTNEDEQRLISLLTTAVEKPVSTAREKQILEAVQSGAQAMVEQARVKFGEAETEFCPYCFRAIDSAYKAELVASINRVLNKDVDIHIADLNQLIFPTLEFYDFDQYEALDPDAVKEIKVKSLEIQDVISTYKSRVTQKKNNVYNPITLELLGLAEIIDSFNAKLDVLEKKRKSFSALLKKKNDIQSEAIKFNRQIAHEEIKDIYAIFLDAKKKQQEGNDKLAGYESLLKHEQDNLKALLEKKANTAIAIDKINWGLDYVFFSKKRLELRASGGSYSLLSNGNPVRPTDVSVGERNIIALCYFFVDVFANQEEDKLYKNEMLVVVDDPVSSFDIENRVGILSFLRHQINKVLSGNKNSKVLIFTHDLITHIDIYRASKELCSNIVEKTQYSYWELRSGKLDVLKDNKSEYKALLETIYEYGAASTTVHDNFGIGNMMRRFLEAFSTFVYQKSSNEVICLPDVVTQLGSKSDYFQNLMFRVVLNNESHL